MNKTLALISCALTLPLFGCVNRSVVKSPKTLPNPSRVEQPLESNVTPFSGGSWTQVTTMPDPRAFMGTAVVNGVIYVIGGAETRKITGSVEAYDPSNGQWASKAAMPTIRIDFAVAVVHGIIYAIGGEDGSFNPPVLNSVEAYDTTTNTWSEKSPLPTPLLGLRAGVVDDKIYTVGGGLCFSCQEVAVNTVYEYDPAADTWTSVAPMPTARLDLAVRVMNGLLYAVGGYGGDNLTGALEAYNPTTNTWATLAPMPTPRGGLAAGVVNGRLYAVGGDNGYTDYAKNEIYNPTTNRWTTHAPLPVRETDLGVGVVNNVLYAVGGFHADKAVPTVYTFQP